MVTSRVCFGANKIRGKEMDRECALVTGATSGIGWATARALAKRGAVVGLLGRRREKAEELAVILCEIGGEGIPLPGDIGEPRQVEAAVAKLVAMTDQFSISFAEGRLAP
jgi:NAD(P)-dependent dehydrogenase (short-subunit alcohol dehydrogenase family)